MTFMNIKPLLNQLSIVCRFGKGSPSTKTINLKAIPEEGSKSQMHQLVVENTNEHFGYVWLIGDPKSIRNGKWTFNRGTAPIRFNWWPEEYYHNTLAGLVSYMEQQFPTAPLPPRKD